MQCPCSPIWHTKTDRARKALNRLNMGLKHAAALGLDVDLPAIEKAGALLGKQRHKTTNKPAMDWREVPAFYKTLCEKTTMTQPALPLLILTSVRPNSLHHICEDQVEEDIWILPVENMKGRRDATTEFRVPLSSKALKIIEQARCIFKNDFLFSPTSRGSLSHSIMATYMRQNNLEAYPHKFRSTLRNWLTETTDAPL